MSDREASPAATSVPFVEHLVEGLREYAIVGLQATGEVAGWSSGGTVLTGYGPEIVGRPLATLFEDPGLVAPLLATAAETGSAELGAWALRSHGGRFWAEGSVSAIRTDAGVGGYAAIFRDATQAKRIREALEVSQATYQGILAIASDAVVCVSKEQKVTFFNRGAEAIFGYLPEEILGQPLETLIPEHARSRHAQHLRDFAASEVPARRMGERGQISGRRKDGTEFPAEASISRLEVGGKRVFTAVVRDVSDRRAVEEALAAHGRELARSNEELEQFAYVASHDLQEPLRMVASYTQLLARRYRGQLDADADEFIGYAVDGVTRMQALINDLLEYSRVGTRDVESTAVSLGSVLDRVLQNLASRIEETGAVFTNDVLPTVRGDRVQLTQVFQNLIGNAIKFRGDRPPHGGCRPGLRRRRGLADGGSTRPRRDARRSRRMWCGVRCMTAERRTATREAEEWHLAVRDHGIGIAPEFQERIFVIFQRLHSRSEYPGTGIGLSICRKIVERHGGRIWVESKPGSGSTFHFTLPARDGAKP